MARFIEVEVIVGASTQRVLINFDNVTVVRPDAGGTAVEFCDQRSPLILPEKYRAMRVWLVLRNLLPHTDLLDGTTT